MEGSLVVIAGAGIVGVSSAFFLTRLDASIRVLLVDPVGVAYHASGKAGGFLARWAAGKETRELHNSGFELHEQLAQELRVESYRKLPTHSVDVATTKKKKKKSESEEENDALDWVAANTQLMDANTAQVNPHELVSKMFDAAQQTKRVQFRKDAVIAIEQQQDGGKRVSAVLCKSGERVACDAFVVATGPWLSHLEQWFPQQKIVMPMSGIGSASLIFACPNHTHATALFCSQDDNECELEIYPRNDGTVYVCGIGGGKTYSSDELQTDVQPDITLAPKPNRVAAAIETLSKVVPSLTNIEPKQQVCLRPIAPDAMPVIGALCENAFCASGLNCWGITWGPAVGKTVAELVLKIPLTCVPKTIKHFDPFRFC